MTAEPVLDVLTICRQDFERRLCAVAQPDWVKPTPCSEWDVRLLVNHVVGQEFRIARLIRGGTVEEYAATRDDDFLGHDPLAAWDEGCRVCDDAITAADDLGRMVVYRLGPTPIRDLLRVRIFDMTVHTWDVSQAIGFDPMLADQTAQVALETIDGLLSDPRTAQFFGAPKGVLASDASAQELLLHLAGR
jgi:uncharacterized protein (TIGR03086 family)